MADNNPNDPWRNRNNDGPPDLMHLLSKLFKKNKKSADGAPQPDNSEAKNIGLFVGILLVIVLIVWFLSGIFIVSPPDQAPILRFGRYVKTAGPGIHWIPRIFESRYPINIQSIRSLDVTADMLTQDENIVSVRPS